MATIIVEQSFDPPMSPDDYSRFAARLDPCLEQYGATWVRSYIAADRTRVVCAFEAADAEAVRTAYRSADVPFDRAWTAEAYEREAAGTS